MMEQHPIAETGTATPFAPMVFGMITVFGRGNIEPFGGCRPVVFFAKQLSKGDGYDFTMHNHIV